MAGVHILVGFFILERDGVVLFASVSRALAGEIAFKNGDLSFNLPYMSLMVCCGIESTLKEWCLNVFFYRSNCFIFFCM